MKTFTDNSGRIWTISINVGAVKRVRAFCDGLNILDLITTDADGNMDSGVLDKLASDPVLLVDVLYAVCKPECDAKSVSDEDFGASLSGDSINAATNALLEDIVDFFPEAKRRIFQRVLAASRRFAEETNRRILAIVESGEIEQSIESRLQKLRDISTNAPESAE